MNSFQKALIGINALLIVVVIVLIAMFNQAGKSKSTAAVNTGDTINVETPPLPKAQGKIMYINVDTFQTKYKFFKKITTELDVQMNSNRMELQRMEKDLMDVYKKYEGQAELMSEEDKYNAQMDLSQL